MTDARGAAMTDYMSHADRFAQHDPEALYRTMRPDQRTAIANEFLRSLELMRDPEVGRFLQESAQAREREVAGARRGSWTPGPPKMRSAGEVAALHRYVMERQPAIFWQVLGHPVTQAALAAPGAEAQGDAGAEGPLLPTVDLPQTSAHVVDPAAGL